MVEDWFRTCARCGAFEFRPIKMFCLTCERRLAHFQLPSCQTQSDQKFPVSALFAWTPESDSLLRPMIYSLKGGRCRSAMREFAETFSWNLELTFDEPVVLIPPPRKTRKPDHALVWAEELARVWKAELWMPLEFEPVAQHKSQSDDQSKDPLEAESQKRRTKSEREQRAFKRVKIAKSERERRFIFADDVLTTGSTTRAAYKALGEPKSFEVWALAWRPKLAGIHAF